MPSRLSSTAFRKQEIGRPRCGAAVREDGRGGQEPQPRHVVVQPLRVRARRRRRRAPRARTGPAWFRRRAGSDPAASRGRSSSATRRALGSIVTWMAARAALAESAPGVDGFVLRIFRELFACARVSRASSGLFDLPSPLRCSRGSGSGARICRRQKTSTLLPAHPVRSEVSKCARQVSWLAARSRFLWPSRGVSSVA